MSPRTVDIHAHTDVPGIADMVAAPHPPEPTARPGDRRTTTPRARRRSASSRQQPPGNPRSGDLHQHRGARTARPCKICAAHGGGYFPHFLTRADHAYQVRPESRTTTKPPSGYLDRLWFDSLLYQPHALETLVSAVGASRIMMGSDYPFDMGVTDSVRRLDALGFPRHQRDAIAGITAAQLLGLPKPQ